MASRHIKRLQKEDLVAVNNSDEHGLSSDPDSPALAAEKNLFSLLTEVSLIWPFSCQRHMFFLV